jgi:hypothetical protein
MVNDLRAPADAFDLGGGLDDAQPVQHVVRHGQARRPGVLLQQLQGIVREGRLDPEVATRMQLLHDKGRQLTDGHLVAEEHAHIVRAVTDIHRRPAPAQQGDESIAAEEGKEGQLVAQRVDDRVAAAGQRGVSGSVEDVLGRGKEDPVQFALLHEGKQTGAVETDGLEGMLGHTHHPALGCRPAFRCEPVAWFPQTSW